MIRLFRFLRPYWLVVLVVLVLVFAQAMANLYLPNLMADIVNRGILTNDQGYIWRTGGLMLLVSLGGTVCAVGSAFFAARVGVGFGRDVRASLFTHVEQFSLHEFDTVSTASLITRTTNDTNQVQQLLVIMLTLMVSAPFTAIGGIILATRQDASLTWVLAVAIPVLIVAILLIMTRAIPLFQAIQKKLDRINLIVDETLTGVRVIRAFDRNQYEEHRFDVANRDLTETALAVNRLVAILFPFMLLVLNGTTVAIFWFGSIRISNQQMSFGALIAFLQYGLLILFAFLMISILFVFVPRAAASATRINEVLDMKPEINDPTRPHMWEAAGELGRADGSEPGERSGRQGIVEFHDITFRYPGAEEPALYNITFTAHPGQVTAIIGGTGAGKSTLVNLIPRFYDVVSGKVLVDGVDVREQRQEDLRAKIGFVPQRAVLFSGTVAENIRFGRQDASDEDVRHAAEVAQATDFIDAMPEQYESYLAQGGTNVSGGQKQRLAIARALVRQPNIYVFDDTFSALDYATDARLRMALRDETTHATVLIVAQRVSTIMNADQIVVLDKGTLAGIGTHRQLMDTNDVYREIVLSQLSAEEVA